jgi:hypothetical protein
MADAIADDVECVADALDGLQGERRMPFRLGLAATAERPRLLGLLEWQGIPAGSWARERDSPAVHQGRNARARAVEQVPTHYLNTRSFEGMRPKR